MRRESKARNIIAGTVAIKIIPRMRERSESVIGKRARGFMIRRLSSQVWRLVSEDVARPVKDAVYRCMHAV